MDHMKTEHNLLPSNQLLNLQNMEIKCPTKMVPFYRGVQFSTIFCPETVPLWKRVLFSCPSEKWYSFQPFFCFKTTPRMVPLLHKKILNVGVIHCQICWHYLKMRGFDTRRDVSCEYPRGTIFVPFFSECVLWSHSTGVLWSGQTYLTHAIRLRKTLCHYVTLSNSTPWYTTKANKWFKIASKVLLYWCRRNPKPWTFEVILNHVVVSCGYGTCFAVRTCDGLYHFIFIIDPVGSP